MIEQLALDLLDLKRKPIYKIKYTAAKPDSIINTMAGPMARRIAGAPRLMAMVPLVSVFAIPAKTTAIVAVRMKAAFSCAAI
jgi:hypothetical protein